MRARLGTLAVGALLTASCGGESEESAPAAASHTSTHAVAHLREELAELGFYSGPIDGDLGPCSS